ncbi:MAG: dihydropteroate synthase, partial [Bradymonadia bacterium]
MDAERWQTTGEVLDWSNAHTKKAATRVMGILNTTPDSFSDGGDFVALSTAIDHARKMIEEGATIIDVGGESSRPGAEPVDVEIEMNRVIPVIEGIRRFSEVTISVDTVKAAVALAAVNAGANIVNDISAGRHDEHMFDVVR